jgi:hypothetical protein
VRTVAEAQPSDIWPNGHSYSPEVVATIRQLALQVPRSEVEDRARRQGWPTWYAAHFIAEEKYQAAANQPRVREEEASELAMLRRRVAELEKQLADFQNFRTVANNNFGELADTLWRKEGDPDDDGEIAELLSDVVKGLIDERIVPLEQRPTMQYRGTYTPTETYQPGDMITFGGQLWYCHKNQHGRASGYC